jgi:hypothetical protein
LNFALSPEAAAWATFWQSVESWLFLLESSAGLLLIALSHPCFAAAATAGFAPELLELVELPELLAVLVAGGLAVDVLDAGGLDAAVLELLLLLLLLLPHPATSAPPTARIATTENSLLPIGPSWI